MYEAINLVARLLLGLVGLAIVASLVYLMFINNKMNTKPRKEIEGDRDGNRERQTQNGDQGLTQ